MRAHDVRLTQGGEPTFVSVDDRDGAEWNTEALGPTKRLLAADMLRRFDHLGAEMADLSARLFGSEEAQEGMRAFLERRPPRWVP